jgi:hypothetical protein
MTVIMITSVSNMLQGVFVGGVSWIPAMTMEMPKINFAGSRLSETE